MRMTKLALMNFKSSFKSYLALIISLGFTILVLYNFQNMIYSEIFVVLGEHNSHLINTLIQMITIVLVIIGVYLLFGGMIPLIFQTMIEQKRFLYRKQRCLWMNNVVFRMKKNYRTYAMVCILGICAILLAFHSRILEKCRFEVKTQRSRQP